MTVPSPKLKFRIKAPTALLTDLVGVDRYLVDDPMDGRGSEPSYPRKLSHASRIGTVERPLPSQRNYVRSLPREAFLYEARP